MTSTHQRADPADSQRDQFPKGMLQSRPLLFFLEGRYDIEFMHRLSTVLCRERVIPFDLNSLVTAGQLILAPLGGGIHVDSATCFSILGCPQFFLFDRESQPETTQRQLTERTVSRSRTLTTARGKTPSRSASLSPDGRFLYVSSFLTSGLHVFARDRVSGGIEHIQRLTDGMNLGAPMCIRISPNGKHGIAACRASSTIALLQRDPNAGTLAIVDVINSSAPDLTPKIPVDAAFSPDSKFVYVVDQAGFVFAFEIADGGKLRHIETFTGPDNCLLQACGIAMNPQGTFVFVVAATASTLSVFRRDEKSGKLELRQVVRDEEGDVHGLGGVFGICCSPDGQQVYTCAGLPGKDNAITAFQVTADGKMSLLQEFMNDASTLMNYQRANEILVTADGRSVYASGTQSKSLACFDRDPESGKLTYLATLCNEGTGSQFAAGPTGLAASADGQFLYVTIEGGSAVSVFERTRHRPR